MIRKQSKQIFGTVFKWAGYKTAKVELLKALHGHRKPVWNTMSHCYHFQVFSADAVPDSQHKDSLVLQLE